MFNKSCQWLDSNVGPLVLEATALPTAPHHCPGDYTFKDYIKFNLSVLETVMCLQCCGQPNRFTALVTEQPTLAAIFLSPNVKHIEVIAFFCFEYSEAKFTDLLESRNLLPLRERLQWTLDMDGSLFTLFLLSPFYLYPDFLPFLTPPTYFSVKYFSTILSTTFCSETYWVPPLTLCGILPFRFQFYYSVISVLCGQRYSQKWQAKTVAQLVAKAQTTITYILFNKMGQLLPLFVYFRSFQTNFYR